MTTVADGLFQYGGMPVGSSLLTNKIFSVSNKTQKKGRAWFVDASSGQSGNGRSPDKPFSTMALAFSHLASGDIIYLVGKVTEQLVTPAQIFDVTVVGCGNRPRHADATPAGGNWAAAQWAPPASGAVSGQATVRVLQQGWRFANILFTMESATAGGIELVRDTGSGNAERDASHCEILGCRFAGAGIGVKLGAAGFTEMPNFLLIQGCRFETALTTAIGGSGQTNYSQILDNFFNLNTNHIKASINGSLIARNFLNTFTTSGIDLSGGINSDRNVVTQNYLSGTYSIGGGYKVHHANDDWGGNWNTGVGTFTTADPA